MIKNWYERRYSHLVGMLVNKGVDEWLAEDCVQQVFLYLIESGRVPANEGALPSWLGRCVINKYGEHVRKESIRSGLWVEEGAAPERFYTIEPWTDELKRRDVEHANCAFSKLDKDERRWFYTHYVQGESMPDIAARLNMPLSTVKTKIRRARLKFISHFNMEESDGKWRRYPAGSPDYHRVRRIKKRVGQSATGVRT